MSCLKLTFDVCERTPRKISYGGRTRYTCENWSIPSLSTDIHWSHSISLLFSLSFFILSSFFMPPSSCQIWSLFCQNVILSMVGKWMYRMQSLLSPFFCTWSFQYFIHFCSNLSIMNRWSKSIEWQNYMNVLFLSSIQSQYTVNYESVKSDLLFCKLSSSLCNLNRIGNITATMKSIEDTKGGDYLEGADILTASCFAFSILFTVLIFSICFILLSSFNFFNASIPLSACFDASIVWDRCNLYW